MKILNILLALLLLAPTAMSQQLPDLGDVSQSDFSPAQERRLGENIMREVRSDRSYSDDVEAVDYLNSLGQRLVAVSGDARQTFDFFLIVDPQINAFALPGGFIGVHSGLILAAQSESELASVVSHEIAHVTQRHIARMLSAQKQAQLTSLAGLALALLAARASADLAQAALVGSQAGYIQGALNFTRDNEREADRVGLQILERAGFDPQATPLFFERLQRTARYVEGGAPSYLRTHPLTFERIADMQNRTQNLPYRQVPDSLEFQLVRAKLRAGQDNARDAVAFFDESLRERKYMSEAASRYGLVSALVRAKNMQRASQEMAALRKAAGPSPLVETLAARVQAASGDNGSALRTYRDALKRYPNYRSIVYSYADALLDSRQPQEALKVIEGQLASASSDHRLYQLQAKSYSALNMRLQQHRAQAEAYYRMGNIQGAIEQLLIAQKAGDGDFYQLSSVDARLRELRVVDNDLRKESRK